MRCDSKKFAQLYEGIYKDLYRFALCRMRDVQEAEDAVSEAVIAAYENIHTLRREESFKNWMFTILLNTCRKKLKRSSERQKKEDTESEKLTKVPAVHPDFEVAMDVRNAFLILSEEEQDIIALSVFGGYNSKEIGEHLGLNPNTVRSKRSRALEKMQCILG